MIDMNQVRPYFPPYLRENASFDKHMLKEYIQLMILDYLAASPHIRKMSFIGDTNLRLIKGIDRFSEDLDFDCKDMSREEFMQMTDDVLVFLRRSGLEAVAKDKENPNLSAFRRNIHFPQLLFDLQLTSHREERFLVKIEMQDQGVAYTPVIAHVRGCGFFFPLPVPPDGVLFSMKLAALLARGKGRDFYDTLFLSGMTQPDYAFLQARCGVGTAEELNLAIDNLLNNTDLNLKKRDFEHLLFQRRNAERILHFRELFVLQNHF